MSITAYAPSLDVRLYGRDHQIDLTPHIGDRGAVNVVRSLYAPVGTATIQLSDRLDAATRETLYGLIGVMDAVVIKMASAGAPKVVMRGYVTHVSRAEGIGADGKPNRTVTIQIADSGKLFQNVQVFFLRQYATGTSLLEQFKFHTATGMDYRTMEAGDYMRAMVEIIDRYVIEFWVTRPDAGIDFVRPDVTVTEGVVNPYGIAAAEGTIWSLMEREADRPFNELFVEDRENAPHLVYRPAAFKDINGAWIPQGGQAVGAETVTVDLQDVEHIDVHRTDADVANFFWVQMDAEIAARGTGILSDALNNNRDTVYEQGHPGNDPLIFGDRKMQVSIRQGYPFQETSYADVNKEEWQVHKINGLDWMDQRRAALMAMNRDNSLFESGTISIRGNPDVRHGKYLAFRRGAIAHEYYVHQVQHAFLPFRKYSTTCQVMRGTGYVNRLKIPRAGIAEGRKDVYGR